MTDTVTFTTSLVPSRETDRAYCVLGGQYLPKSQVTVGEVQIERWIDGGKNRFGKKLSPILVQIVEVTMPKWLVK